MLANTLRFFAVAAGAAVAPEISKLLAAMGFRTGITLIAAALGGAAVYYLLEAILVRLPFRFHVFRMLLDHRARVEGSWIQTKHDAHVRPYSFVTIYWNHDTEDWMITGVSTTETGEIGALWHSTKLNIDLAALQLSYLFRAELYFGSAEQVVEGFGIMTFVPNRRGALNRATGYFLDATSGKDRHGFKLERLTAKDTSALISKDDCDSHEDMRRLINAYHEKEKLLVASAPKNLMR
jgi:hypothetical protein